MKAMVSAFMLAAAVAAWGGDEPARPLDEPSYDLEQVPARLAASVHAADEAIRALQRRLSTRLLEELKEGGPALAISVCRDEAQALTAETARAQGIRVGRTSHRLRNPRNAAPSWAERFIEAEAGRPAASVKAVAVDLGDRVGVLRPIPTMGMCTQCHGRAARLSDELTAFLKTHYPEDRAVGFEEGDLRGFLWAEAPAP